MRLNGLGRNKHPNPTQPLGQLKKTPLWLLRLQQVVSVSKRTGNGGELATYVDFLVCHSLSLFFCLTRRFSPSCRGGRGVSSQEP
jgi:hypothetical protein